jgi:hypothetical protein
MAQVHLRHVLDIHIRGHEVFDSFLIPLIFRHGSGFRHVLDFHTRGHDVFDSFLIPLIVGYGQSSFRLRHILNSHICGHEVCNSFLIPLICGTCSRLLPSQTCLRFSHSREHDVFDSFLSLIFRHGPSSSFSLLRHVLGFHVLWTSRD